MEKFELQGLLEEHAQKGKLYHEFLRVPSLSAGIYILPENGTDPQLPHSEDEMYYIISGKGMITVGSDDQPVQAGSLIYVPAQIEHRFHDVKEKLVILVFFAASGSMWHRAPE